MIIASNRKGVARGVIVLVALLLSAAWNVQASASPVPFVESISPLSVASGGATFTLTVTGTGFVSDSVVNFGGTALTTTYVSDTQVTAAVTGTLIASSGAGWITVTNPGTPNRVSNLIFLNIGASSSTLNLVNTPLTAGSGPITAAQGDFNGDGKVDLVVANWSGDSLSVFLGNGDGTFQTPQTISLSTVSLRPIGLAVGDFNNDGKIDIAVGYESSTGVSVLLGNGDGTFQAPLTVAAGPNTYALVVGDFNGDGNLDIAASNYGAGTVNILLGNGDGTFQTAVSHPTSVSQGWFIQVADLIGNGKLDLVVSDYAGTNIGVLLGNGDGTFQTSVTYITGQ
ncbi:MAG: FG-GAP-like repeat-containing protein, partial [Candidatus Acidiferrales bacterium]